MDIARRCFLESAVTLVATPTILPWKALAMIDHIDPRDFGVNIWTGGDDTAAIQAAINAGKATGTTVMLPGGTGNFTPPLDLTNYNLPNGKTLRIEGAGNAWGGTMLRALSGGAVGLDCVGAQGIGLSRFTLGAAPDVELIAGILLAASTTRPLDMVVLDQLYVSAPFTWGAIYGFAWHSSVVQHCKLYNYRENNQPTVLLTSINRYNLTSPFVTFATPAQVPNLSDIDFIKNEVHDFSQQFEGTCFLFDGPTDIAVIGGNISQIGNPARAYCQALADPKRITFNPVRAYVDSGTPSQHVFHVQPGEVAHTIDFHVASSLQYSVSKLSGTILA